ncbi:hypothetical protein C1H46_013924 [Malus baccata]|uniref:Beta-glucosidase n=1 Tax=Malus baccata TaxID=106549 RepID=A0A540MNX3_MALBA|nr:hypothetical protein C1H46_013924 [Malus baccata]
MAKCTLLLGLLLVLGCALKSSGKSVKAKNIDESSASLNRSSFPKGFVFGTASSAYQEDVQIMKDIGLDAYRFSISWSRLLPEFGDKVKHWITLNEPLSVSKNGYTTGKYAPGRCSDWLKLNCLGGDSGTEPYLVTHHQLLAHAAAVKLYREKYQKSQKGVIGITLNSDWYVPVTEERNDKDAAKRALDFSYGWFMDPLVKGHYPHSMQALVENRLPKFTKEQSAMLKGSYDFIGLNYYSGTYAANVPHQNDAKPNYKTDALVNQSVEYNGVPIGPLGASDWLHVYPRGIRDLLVYTKRKYQNPLIYITENGYDDPNDPNMPIEESLADKKRIDYLDRHIHYIHRAIEDGVNVMGYFIWSLFDNMEWNTGYTVRFGINYIDFKDGLKRHPKDSAKWLKKFLKTENHEDLQT